MDQWLMNPEEIAILSIIAGSWLIVLFSSLLFHIIYWIPFHIIGRRFDHPAPWIAYIPIINMGYYFHLAGMSWLWIFVMFVPILNLIMPLIAIIKICERLKRPAWWGVIITFVPLVSFILLYMLAFGEAKPQRN
jgi:hypothetical protein